MISFDYLTLKAFNKENSNFFNSARIQKIQAPSRKELLLTLRNNGETRKFYVNIDPNLHHLCFLTKDTEARRDIEIQKKPTMFCMLLRKYIESGKISHINVPEYERIFEIYIESYNELGDKIYLCLAVELMGKYSNIILYNHDTNIIIGCCHNVGEEKSRNREMAGLLPYVYPQKQLKSDILNYNGEIFNLNENFLGFSKAFEAQLKGKNLTEIRNYILLKGLSPAIDEDFSEYSLFSELLKNPAQKASVNEMIDDYFCFYQEKAILKNLKTKLNSTVNQKYKKVLTSLDKITRQIEKEEKADKYRIYGDLLMANLYQLKDFSPSVEVFNYETNENITINLDETKTVKENAQKFFKLYNKSKRSCEKLHELFEKHSADKIYLESLIYNIENATSTTILREIEDEITPSEKPRKEKSEILEEVFENYTIFIGQSNKQNDLIVSKLSDKDDLWFHVKDCAGSHVLLKNPSKQTPEDKLILHCAKLAKKYSKAKNSPKAGVIYTYRKNLKKPPAANLGYVIYKNETEILVN